MASSKFRLPKCSQSTEHILNFTKIAMDFIENPSSSFKKNTNDMSIKNELDKPTEKKVLSFVFEKMGGYIEKTIEGRKIKLLNCVIEKINENLKDDRLIFYGSSALGLDTISDYDFMYLPKNYENIKFNDEIFLKMYSFMDGLRNLFNTIMKSNDIK